MQPDFWHQRWADNQIGFHQSAPTTLLLKHWPTPWRARRRDRIRAAVRQVAGHGVAGIAGPSGAGCRTVATRGGTVLCRTRADAGDPRIPHTARTTAPAASRSSMAMRSGWIATSWPTARRVFDRAAMIALPPSMRARYADELYARLPTGCRGLLVTLEYPQAERDGPPFAIGEDEVRERYASSWQVELLERRPIPAGPSRLCQRRERAGYVGVRTATPLNDACAVVDPDQDMRTGCCLSCGHGVATTYLQR